MENTCRRCGSLNIKYSKEINIGPIMGVSYHYVATCLNCGRRYKVERTKEILAKMPYESWKIGKKAQKRIDREKIIKTQSSLF